MARFPTREAEIATLATEIISGLTENAEDYPAPPITTEVLQSKLDAYWHTHEAAVLAQGAAAEAFAVKKDALEELADDMRLVLRYAEHATKNDEVKLRALGWGVRKTASPPREPGPARALEIKREGPGWIYLDWKRPSEGGTVGGYHVQATTTEGGGWSNIHLCFDTMAVLTEQKRGVELHFRIVSFNKTGEGLASNTVTAVL